MTTKQISSNTWTKWKERGFLWECSSIHKKTDEEGHIKDGKTNYEYKIWCQDSLVRQIHEDDANSFTALCTKGGIKANKGIISPW